MKNKSLPVKMGQKVHPKGMRVGLRSEWPSRWFGGRKNYRRWLLEDLKIRQAVFKQFDTAGIEKIDIKRNSNLIELEIRTAKPGVIIGKGGAGTKLLKELIERVCDSTTEKPHVRISIMEAGQPDLSARMIAENIAKALERRINVRRAVSQVMERAKEGGADGIKIRVAGRLNGADIARSEFASFGSVPLSTFKADVNYAMIHAWTTYGTIGVKVWVYKRAKNAVT